MGDYDERLAEVLTPCAPPEVIDGVYRDGEFERMLDVVKRRGPWPTIVSHHFQSVDELDEIPGLPREFAEDLKRRSRV